MVMTPLELKSLEGLIKSTLKEGYKKFSIREEGNSYILSNDYDIDIYVNLIEPFETKRELINYVFEKIVLTSQYDCLKQLKIESFNEKTNELIILNINNKRFSFSSVTPIQSVLEAIELFTNAKTTYDTLIECLKDARKRNRFDLVDSYISKLSQIVKISDYSKKIT